MRQIARTAAYWLKSEDRFAVLGLRLRRMLTVEKRLKVDGSKLIFSAESWVELTRSQNVTEGWTAAWVRGLPSGAVLWDVGANVGVFALLAAETPNVRHVVAIEPSVFNFTGLVRNIMLNRLSAKVTPLPVGLGDTTGRLDFNLQNLKEGGSMHSFAGIFPFKDRSVTPAASYGCLCYRLDDLVRIDGLPFPSHLKIDIDGLERTVLEGGRTVLADPRLVAIQVEVMDTEADLPRRREIVAMLEPLGWTLTETIPHGASMPAIADLRFGRP